MSEALENRSNGSRNSFSDKIKDNQTEDSSNNTSSSNDNIVTNKVQDTKLIVKVKQCLLRFYELMNEEGKILGLNNSQFASTHGMFIETNYSTAEDMAKLSYHCMKIDLFKSIVATQYRECASKEYPGHIYKWTNTNFLLNKEANCTGLKTGVTPVAGPCLAATMKKDGYHLCIIILNCVSMESRWVEVPKLVNWGIRKLQRV